MTKAHQSISVHNFTNDFKTQVLQILTWCSSAVILYSQFTNNANLLSQHIFIQRDQCCYGEQYKVETHEYGKQNHNLQKYANGYNNGEELQNAVDPTIIDNISKSIND